MCVMFLDFDLFSHYKISSNLAVGFVEVLMHSMKNILKYLVLFYFCTILNLIIIQVWTIGLMTGYDIFRILKRCHPICWQEQ